MVVPKEKRGILLSFPTRENATPRPKNESCPECGCLETAYEVVIAEIKAIVRGPFPTVREKLTRLYHKQDERDRILAQLYSHKRENHLRKRA